MSLHTNDRAVTVTLPITGKLLPLCRDWHSENSIISTQGIEEAASVLPSTVSPGSGTEPQGSHLRSPDQRRAGSRAGKLWEFSFSSLESPSDPRSRNHLLRIQPSCRQPWQSIVKMVRQEVGWHLILMTPYASRQARGPLLTAPSLPQRDVLPGPQLPHLYQNSSEPLLQKGQN